MGTTVYDAKEEVRLGAHVYAQSRKDGKEGTCYLIINNSETETTTVDVPVAAGQIELAPLTCTFLVV